jgi:hypothetical protein
MGWPKTTPVTDVTASLYDKLAYGRSRRGDKSVCVTLELVKYIYIYI